MEVLTSNVELSTKILGAALLLCTLGVLTVCAYAAIQFVRMYRLTTNTNRFLQTDYMVTTTNLKGTGDSGITVTKLTAPEEGGYSYTFASVILDGPNAPVVVAGDIDVKGGLSLRQNQTVLVQGVPVNIIASFLFIPERFFGFKLKCYRKVVEAATLGEL